MQKRLVVFFGLLIVSFNACTPDENHADEKNIVDSVSDSAQKQITVPEDTVALPANSDSIIEPGFAAQLVVLFTHDYCGGARPSEEIMAHYTTPTPLSNSKLQFIETTSRKEFLCATDSKGKCTVRVEPGKYDVYLTKSISQELETGFSPNCKAWFKRKMADVLISPGMTKYTVEINFVCNPCDEGINRRP